MKDQFLHMDLNVNQCEEVRLESSVAQWLERLKSNRALNQSLVTRVQLPLKQFVFGRNSDKQPKQ